MLKANALDGAWPSRLWTRPNIRWTNSLAPPGEEPLEYAYDAPVHLDWGRAELEPPVIEGIVIAVHLQTAQGRMTAVLRQSALLSPP